MRIYFSLIACVVALCPTSVRAEERTGQQIYQQMCDRCHGDNGEGTKKAPDALIGDRSIAQLARVIDETMPEDDPDKLDAAESKLVAEYIHKAFYSPAAQARLNPPRIALTHLTVGQYRNAVADIVASFRPATKLGNEHGLRGEYFNDRRFRRDKRLIERTDLEVNFDFGKEPPEDENTKGKFDANEFSISWAGSVIAPETGVYEFIVQTDHALRLWVNDREKPLIDRFVKSGSDTEFRAAIFLLAGRAYPVKLEFSKAKQGVNDMKKVPPKPAFIKFAWKRPHGADEIIPSRCLTPESVPEVCVISSPFPPDDRSLGWERGTSVSKEWDGATTDAAIEAANYILPRLSEFTGSRRGSPPDAAKLRQFCEKFAERAFRRPLTDAEKRVYIDLQFSEASDAEAATKRVVLFVLKSPRFLYPDLDNVPENYAIATRLSLALWDSAPDDELLAAAAAGKLTNRAEVVKHAERMLNDPRAKTKLRRFLLTWLHLGDTHELAKDEKRFPEFNEAVAADLRTSLELFLDDVVWGSGNGDFRKLLLADEIYVNERLAKLYGVDAPENGRFAKVKFEPDRRSGVLTHPYLLSKLAYTAESSPIHRGVFVARGLLGVNVRPPKEAFTPLPAEEHPDLTTRDRVTLQTKPAACAGCHSIMNPLGFTLENFDAIGRYRAEENKKPIDTSGSYETRAGPTAKFTGAKDLAKFLADSPEVHIAFAERLFHHVAKQPVMAYGIERPEELRAFFEKSDYNIRKLAVEAAVTATMKKARTNHRATESTEERRQRQRE